MNDIEQARRYLLMAGKDLGAVGGMLDGEVFSVEIFVSCATGGRDVAQAFTDFAVGFRYDVFLDADQSVDRVQVSGDLQKFTAYVEDVVAGFSHA